MIKPEQVPLEVWIALRDHVRERPYGYDYTEAIAAALNAWPGMTHMEPDLANGIIILPLLPQEASDDHL